MLDGCKGMIISINEQYRITTDPYQWIVQKRRTRNGGEAWESQTYHPSFESALQSLGERLVRGSDAETLVGCLGRCRKGHHHPLPSSHTPVRASFNS